MIEGTALIKFTKSEVQLLINSLHMSITTVVPCVEGSEWKKPYKNLKKDLKIGSLFTTERKTRGVLIDCSTNAIVIITSSPNTRPEDNNFYLGKKTISAHTEVKEIR